MAGELYKIIDLDINFDKMIASTAEAKKQLAAMKAELALLKKEGKENTEEFIKLDTEIKSLNNEVRVNTKILTDATSAANAQTASVDQLRKMLSVVSAQWAQLSEEERQNSNEGVTLSKQKLDLTNRLKELESATGDNRRNVGNYTASIIEAGNKMGIFGGTFGNILSSLEGMKAGLTATRSGLAAASGGATGFAGAMNVVKVAIASTGIGLLVIAIGSLISWLSKVDPVVDKVEQVFAGFGAAIDVVKTTILKFIEGIKSVGDLMSKLGDIVKNPVASFKALAGSMAEAAIEAAKLKEAQQDLADAQQVQEVLTARANQQVKELILQSKNRSLSEKERQDLLAKAAKIDQEDFDRKSRLAEEGLRIQTTAIAMKADLNAQEIAGLKKKGVEYALELLNQGKIMQEDVDAYKKAELEKIAILDETTSRQEKIQNQSDALEEKRQAKLEAQRKAAADAEKKRAEEAQKKQEKIIKDLQEQLAYAEALAGKNPTQKQLDDIFQKRLDLLSKQKLSETAYQTELIKIWDDYAAAVEERQKRIADNAKRLAEEQLAAEKEAIARRIEQEQIDSDKAQAERDKKRQAYITDFENDLAIRQLQGESLYQLRLEQLERERTAEILAAEKVGADTTKIMQKYELLQVQIKRDAQRSMLGTLADGLGTVADLLGKNTVAGKAAGIAQATINTYLGVSQVLAAPPSGPEPFNTITKAVSIATTIGTGLANVANIVKVPTKFESGGIAGMTGGKRHSAGGTKYYGEDGNVVELEQGENWYVLNRGASKAINALSALNTQYGGVDFSMPVTGGMFADGGMVSRSLQMPDLNPQIAMLLADVISEIRPVVDVKDIITGVNSRVELIDNANI